MPTSNAKLTESAVQGLIKLGNPPQKRKNTRRRKNRKSRKTRKNNTRRRR